MSIDPSTANKESQCDTSDTKTSADYYRLKKHIQKQLEETEFDFKNSRIYQDNLQLPVQPSWSVDRWLSLFESHYAVPGVRTSFGNRLELFLGEECSEKLCNAIKSAEERIWIETYIFDNSRFAATILYELIKAKKERNVDVVLVIDKFGSSLLPSEWTHRLKEAGIPLHVFHFWGNVFVRDHRKIAIIDKKGFCGSNNISDGSSPEHLGGTNFFFDVMVQLEGPGVKDLQDIFLDSHNLRHLTNAPIESIPSIPRSENGDVLIQIVESNPLARIKAIQASYSRILSTASFSISAMTGYFDPPWWLKRSLKRAASRSIPIHLSLTGNSDVIADTKATKYLICKYLSRKWSQSSLQTWISTDRHCHGKMVLVDYIWAAAGSYNWDRFSGRRNLEVAISVLDARFAKQVQAVNMRLTGMSNQPQHEKERYIRPQPKQADIIWTVNEKKAMRRLYPSNLALYPRMIEISREKCSHLSLTERCTNRFARYCVKLSASSVFDRFDEFDAQTYGTIVRQKVARLQKIAEYSFLFGPSKTSMSYFEEFYP